jgi:ankyrin repeat protein
MNISELPIEMRAEIFSYCKQTDLMNFGEANIKFIPEILKATKKASVLWFEAAANKFPNWIRTMIRLGYDINAQCNVGWTALHYATCNCNIQIMDILMKNGADLDKSGRGVGWSPLYLAVHFNHISCIKKLLDAHADVNKKCHGWTVLHLAAEQKDPEVLEMLIKAGADVNLKITNTGMTALHLAARNGCERCVRILLKNKADPKLEDNFGYTAHNTAQQFRMLSIIELLRRY